MHTNKQQSIKNSGAKLWCITGHETEYRRPEKPWNPTTLIEAVSLWPEGYRNTIAIYYRWIY
jgi:hypothetical protein